MRCIPKSCDYRVNVCHVQPPLALHTLYTVLCRSLDSPPDRSNWGLTNQRREELFRHTNTHLSLVSSKLSICNRCLATYKARYMQGATCIASSPGATLKRSGSLGTRLQVVLLPSGLQKCTRCTAQDVMHHWLISSTQFIAGMLAHPCVRAHGKVHHPRARPIDGPPLKWRTIPAITDKT